jgi:hypothetical protein
MMPLCNACRNLSPTLHNHRKTKEVPETSYRVHHQTFGDMTLSAADDCYICTRLWFTILKEVDILVFRSMQPATYYMAETWGHTKAEIMEKAMITFFRKGLEVDKDDWEVVETFVCIPLPSPSKLHTLADKEESMPKKETATDATPHDQHLLQNGTSDMDLAKQWMTRCQGSHDHCTTLQDSWYPTRLLDISGQTSHIRLIVTKDQPMAGPYASLSHCWGKSSITTLKISNLHIFLKSISVNMLPNTFQHAVNIARTMQISYLWIDSLCIVQDSDEDWTAESAMMGSVYQNALVNLSAAGANDGTEGFHFERTQNMSSSLPICPAFRNYDWRTDLSGNGDTQWHFVDPAHWQRNCMTCPVFGRAWIYQERILARRVLHFGRHEMFWECRTDNYCETFPDGLPFMVRESSTLVSKQVYERFKRATSVSNIEIGRLRHVRNKGLQAKIEVFWEILVTDYSRCKLTKAQDKLIALAGVTEDVWKLQRANLRVDGVYLAGIWKQYLPHSLLWKVKPEGKRPEVYCAPTWSWASVVGLISWDNNRWKHEFEYTAQVESVHVQPINTAFGQVCRGRIVIRGTLCRLRWSASKGPIQGSTSLQVHVAKNKQAKHLKKRANHANPGALSFYPDDRYQVYEKKQWGYIYGLEIVRYKDESVMAPVMLVLEVLPGQRSIFRRIGIAFSGGGLRASRRCKPRMVDALVTII